MVGFLVSGWNVARVVVTDVDDFAETKELKKRVRDVIEPGRDLGHVDGKKSAAASAKAVSGQGNSGISTEEVKRNLDGSVCEDCT